MKRISERESAQAIERMNEQINRIPENVSFQREESRIAHAIRYSKNKPRKPLTYFHQPYRWAVSHTIFLFYPAFGFLSMYLNGLSLFACSALLAQCTQQPLLPNQRIRAGQAFPNGISIDKFFFQKIKIILPANVLQISDPFPKRKSENSPYSL